MHKRIKTKKVKTSEECNKKEFKDDGDDNNNIYNNNDCNDSNRKGKAIKVATQKTLKIKKIPLA